MLEPTPIPAAAPVERLPEVLSEVGGVELRGKRVVLLEVVIVVRSRMEKPELAAKDEVPLSKLREDVVPLLVSVGEASVELDKEDDM